MSSNITNPFRSYRAEQLGEAIWEYYVPPDENLLSETPLIFEGSRGTGKTMFLLCNSWREKFSEYDATQTIVDKLLCRDSFVGIYYKVDGRFVGNNLSGKGIDDNKWISIFNTYFNVIISKEIYAFLCSCIELGIINESLLNQLNNRVSSKIGLSNGNSEILSIDNRFDDLLDEIEEYTNNPEQNLPKLLSAGTLIKTIIEQVKKIEIFKNTRFHLLIDEYEELNAHQQIQVNTLIKQSVYWLVYDICVKTNGIYTSNTISGNEIIQEPHDFRLYKPELTDYDNSSKYVSFLKNICRKRLNKYIDSESSDYEDHTDIEFYLKRYSSHLIQNEYKSSPNYKKEITDYLSSLIEKDITSRNIQKDELEKVIYDTSPQVERMHISLLMRNDVTVEILYNAASTCNSVYEDWRHNTMFATHFLLCNELGIDFKYHGLKVFAQLSSGVIRYFIEICKSAFDNALDNGFTFSAPRSFSIIEQTDAAQFVSESKVAKIDGFVPGGKVLKKLVLNLGKIFNLIQTNRSTTLGEPEVNHFTTSLFDLRTYHQEAAQYLDFAVMHNILQASLPTKTKSNDIVEIADYHLNHIYCPFFKISHRRKRKINLDHNVLNKLITGNTEEINKIVKKYGEFIDDQSLQSKLF